MLCFLGFQGFRLSEGERWSKTSDETILQSGGEFISLSCSVDGLPACWGPWLAQDSYLCGMVSYLIEFFRLSEHFLCFVLCSAVAQINERDDRVEEMRDMLTRICFNIKI